MLVTCASCRHHGHTQTPPNSADPKIPKTADFQPTKFAFLHPHCTGASQTTSQQKRQSDMHELCRVNDMRITQHIPRFHAVHDTAHPAVTCAHETCVTRCYAHQNLGQRFCISHGDMLSSACHAVKCGHIWSRKTSNKPPGPSPQLTS
jgi:hypothetical protein